MYEIITLTTDKPEFLLMDGAHFSRSLIEKSKDKLELIVKRTGIDKARTSAQLNGDVGVGVGNKHNYAPQNLFVQPSNVDEKNNLARAIYSTSGLTNGDLAPESTAAPPRPPLPQDDGKSLNVALISKVIYPFH